MPYNIIVNIDKKIVFNVRSKLENRVKDCEERMIPLNTKLKEILIAIPWRVRFIFFIQSGTTWKNNLSLEFQKVVSQCRWPAGCWYPGYAGNLWKPSVAEGGINYLVSKLLRPTNSVPVLGV